jgi:hypothetical protein
MGAWGVGGFENDDALDWAANLMAADNLEPVLQAFEAVERSSAYIEVQPAAAALAAAEVVAALRSRPGQNLPESVRRWITEHPKMEEDMPARAQRALKRVGDNSELTELFEESGSANAWRNAMEDLEARLA